jgi:hypothetical protein
MMRKFVPLHTQGLPSSYDAEVYSAKSPLRAWLDQRVVVMEST